MTVFIPGNGREGWQVNLRRKDGGWCSGKECDSLEAALASTAAAFAPWSERQSPAADDEFEDLLG